MLNLSDKSPEEIQQFISDAKSALLKKQKRHCKQVIKQIKHLANSIGVTVIFEENSPQPTKKELAEQKKLEA